MESQSFDVDCIIEKIGHYKTYSVKNILLLSFAVLMTAFYTTSFVFTAEIHNHRCKIPECDDVENQVFLPDWLSNAVPFKGVLPERCERYHSLSNETIDANVCPEELFNKNVTEQCKEYIFASDKITIANDFDIYCDNNLWKLTSVGTVNNFGQLLCLPMIGYFSDRFGRRSALVWGLLFSAIFGIARSFSPSYLWFLIFEFLDPLFGSGAYSSAFILGMELVDPTKRVLGSAVICSAYAFGEAILGAIAWITTSWRTLLLVLYAPGLLLVSYFWLIPESVRWLISKERYEEAEDVLKSAAKMNNISLSDDVFKNLKLCNNPNNNEKKEITTPYDSKAKHPMKEVFTDVSMLLRVLNCSLCWITCNFVYYGLSLNSVAIGGNAYINFISVSLIEIPGYIVTYFVLDTIGRRASLCASLFITGSACVGFLFIPPDLEWIKLVLFLIGKCGITISFTTLYVFTAELFHTPVRHSLLGFCSMLGKTGALISPQTPLLAELWEPLPLLLYGLISLISGLLSLLFPETLNIKLPDTIEEAKNITKVKDNHFQSLNAS